MYPPNIHATCPRNIHATSTQPAQNIHGVAFWCVASVGPKFAVESDEGLEAYHIPSDASLASPASPVSPASAPVGAATDSSAPWPRKRRFIRPT